MALKISNNRPCYKKQNSEVMFIIPALGFNLNYNWQLSVLPGRIFNSTWGDTNSTSVAVHFRKVLMAESIIIG